MKRLFLLACLVAATVVTPSVASADLMISPSGAVTATSIGTMNVNTVITTLRCNMIIHMNLRSGPIARGSSAGAVTSLSFTPNPCQGVLLRALGLPWDLRFTNASTPGSVYLFTVAGMARLWSVIGNNCLYSGDIGLSYSNTTGVWTILGNSFPGTALAPTLPICGNASFAGSGFQSSRIGGSFPQGAGS